MDKKPNEIHENLVPTKINNHIATYTCRIQKFDVEKNKDQFLAPYQSN